MAPPSQWALAPRSAGSIIRDLVVKVTYPKHLYYDWDTFMPYDYGNSIVARYPTVNLCLESLLDLKPGAKVMVELAQSQTDIMARHPPDSAMRERALLTCVAPLIGVLRKLQQYGLLIEVVLADYGCRLSGPAEPVSRELWEARLEAYNAKHNNLLALGL